MKLTGTNPFLLATLGCLAMTGVTAAAESEGARDLGTKVRSLLEDRCFECHSHSAKKLKAGLFLDSRSGFLTGGDSGPAIVPGDVENSLLVEAVRYQNVDLQMPPKSKLGDDDIALLESWVKAGAPWPEDAVATGAAPRNEFNLQERRREHWAWQPVRNPALPAVKDADWPAQPPDRFILSKLEAAGLDPAPEADRRTLIRRLSLILTGLPPSPEEVRSFVSDPAPDAYGRLIGRLLASDSFGERWARHWLDVVRYSETLGHEFDYPMPNAWRYRDYAIRAFNADVPYDRFVREHIAGDLLEHPRRDPESGVNESALATAYHWFGQQVHSPVDIKGNQLDVIDNQIDTLTRGFQALTVSCARCHDHKFDAISTKDFYALYGVFASTRYAQRDISSPDAFTEPLGRLTELRAQFTREIGVAPIAGDSSFAFAGWQLRGAAMKDPVVPVGDVVFAGPTNPVTRARVPLLSSRKLSTRLQGAARSPSFVISDRYLHVRAAGRGSRLKLVIENFQMIQNPIYGELKKTLDRDDLGWTTFNLGMWTNRVAYLEALDLGAPDLAGMAGGGVSDSGWFDLAEVIASGDSKPPGREAGFDKVEATDAITALLAEIAVVGGELPEPMLAPLVTDSEGIDQPVLVRGGPGKPGEPVERRFLEALGGLEHSVENGSGRRQVAELIASPENPLTARVWVNRVWHHLFGRGIVPTVDDFGVLGDDPSHPELLDW
ncbi:MAG TPA: hypothetical protein DCY13_13665, partial [Verrucomicrobiales bacterium]|nr:hypothetical protein [Verrucomicrobiales bacterium]